MVQQMWSVAGETPRIILEAADNSPSRHVLVVDDDRLVRWAISETLTARGYDVMEAGDAKSAMQTFDRADARADVVLLDLRLPDADDLRLLSFIRERSPDTAVIVMTAFGPPDILDQAAARGAAVLAKPFDMTELAAAVERSLRA